MKFFRQTKETKRKLSFFLALAMVISLLPVSPVAKAATQEIIGFYCNIDNVKIDSITQEKTSAGTPSTGTAIIILKSTNGKKIKSITGLDVKLDATSTSTASNASIVVSGSSAEAGTFGFSDVKNGTDGTWKVTVSNLHKAKVVISGTPVFEEDGNTGDDNQGGNPTPTPTPETVVGTVSGSAAGIKEVSVDVPSGQGNIDNVNGNLANVKYYKNASGKDYTEAEVKEALKDASNIKTALVLSEPEAEVKTAAVSNVKSNKNNIKNLSSTVDQASFDKMVNEGVVLDIDLTSYIMNGSTTMASIKMSNLKNAVTVKMDIPTSLEQYEDVDGYYYVIRIHGDGKITIIECKKEGEGKISFESDKFSTYIVTFKKGVSIVDKSATDPTPTPSGSNKPGNNNGYIPGPGQSSSPSANPSTAPSTNPSANPSGAPSANPSGAPSANPSSTPSANPSGAPTDPTNAPTEPTKAPTNPTKKPSTSVKVGKKATISGSQYKVTAVKGTRTVQFTKGKKNAKKIVIPSTVKVSGKSYKVTTIAKNALKGNKKLTKLTIGANVTKIGANAFKGCSKLKSIIVKTKKLTKSKVGTNAFKGINAKATVKVPKAKVKAYKKIVKAKGAGKNVKVKK